MCCALGYMLTQSFPGEQFAVVGQRQKAAKNRRLEAIRRAISLGKGGY